MNLYEIFNYPETLPSNPNLKRKERKMDLEQKKASANRLLSLLIYCLLDRYPVVFFLDKDQISDLESFLAQFSRIIHFRNFFPILYGDLGIKENSDVQSLIEGESLDHFDKRVGFLLSTLDLNDLSRFSNFTSWIIAARDSEENRSKLSFLGNKFIYIIIRGNNVFEINYSGFDLINMDLSFEERLLILVRETLNDALSFINFTKENAILKQYEVKYRREGKEDFYNKIKREILDVSNNKRMISEELIKTMLNPLVGACQSILISFGAIGSLDFEIKPIMGMTILNAINYYDANIERILKFMHRNYPMADMSFVAEWEQINSSFNSNFTNYRRFIT